MKEIFIYFWYNLLIMIFLLLWLYKGKDLFLNY